MMKNLTLEHIAAACHGTYYGSEEKKSQCIEAVTTDSRKVEKGCLFVPIVGARADGHKFIADSGCRDHRKCGKDQHERDDCSSTGTEISGTENSG